MGCTSSSLVPKSESREDIVQWYKGGPKTRLQTIQPSSTADATRFTFDGKPDGNHTDLTELQFLSRAVTVKTFTYHGDEVPLKNLKEGNTPDAAYAEFAKHAQDLEHLVFFGLGAPSQCFVTLLQHLASPTKLTRLSFTRMSFENDVIDAIQKSGLVNVTTLTLNTLSNMPVGRRWDTLFAGLPSLTDADLSGVKIDGAGLKALTASKKLKVLNVSMCTSLKPGDFAIIPQHCPVLQELDIGGCEVTGALFRNMVTHAMPKLYRFNLGNSAVTMYTDEEKAAGTETFKAFADMVVEYLDRVTFVIAKGQYADVHELMKARAKGAQ